MDRASTLSWGGSLECLDEVISDTSCSNHDQARDMAEEVSKLTGMLKGLIAASPGKVLADLDTEVMGALTNWYKGIKDCAFMSLAAPSPITLAGQTCFDSFGCVRGAQAEVQAQLAAMQSKLQQADQAVESTLRKILGGAQDNDSNRAAVIKRMAEWKQGIFQKSAALLEAAKAKAASAEDLLCKHAVELVSLIDADAARSTAESPTQLDIESMMQEVEAQFLSLDMSADLPTSGTGGTSQDPCPTEDTFPIFNLETLITQRNVI